MQAPHSHVYTRARSRGCDWSIHPEVRTYDNRAENLLKTMQAPPTALTRAHVVASVICQFIQKLERPTNKLSNIYLKSCKLAHLYARTQSWAVIHHVMTMLLFYHELIMNLFALKSFVCCLR